MRCCPAFVEPSRGNHLNSNASALDARLPAPRARAWRGDARPQGPLEPVATIGAALGIFVGTVAIAGWALGWTVLTQFFATRSAMQPITAACAMLVGVGVIVASRRPDRTILTRFLATLVFLAALQTLAQFALGADFGTDRLLFARGVASQPVRYPHPGRMAAPTATAYLLIAVALLCAGLKHRFAGLIVSASATAVLLLITIALLGYFFMAAPLTGVFGFTQVSVPTACALGGLSVGVLALRPDDGWVRLLVGGSVGATAARWLLPGVVVVPIAVAALALRGSEVGLYPADFRLAFTTAATIVLLAALALWGVWQLDHLVAVRRSAEALRESEATLRAFFETEGLFASIIERQGDDFRYLAATSALAGLHGHADIAGLSVRAVEAAGSAEATIERLAAVETSGKPLALEQALETGTGTRWFAVTISPVAGRPSDRPRFATAAFEITERKRAEAQQRLLLEELNHRAKNTLAVVQSLAQQSFRGDLADPAAKKAFEARLAAVASAHSLLVRQDWTSASLRALVADVAGPGCGADPARIDADGPDLALPPRTAVSVALALHELCTNAVKYGALSNDAGRVSLRWTVDPSQPGLLCMIWTERGGPPVITPSTRGFGSRLIERALTAELGRPVLIEFRPGGVVCRIEASLRSHDKGEGG